MSVASCYTKALPGLLWVLRLFFSMFVKLRGVLYLQVFKVVKRKESILMYGGNLVVIQISGDESRYVISKPRKAN